MMWLTVPVALVSALVAAVPRLEAEESIARVSEAYVAADGTTDGAREIRARWQDAVRRPNAVAGMATPITKRPDPAPILTSRGFKVNRIPTTRRAAPA